MKVVIVGAGIAGLSAAIRLHEIGWDVVVLERAPRLRDSGYVVNLSDLGYRAAERMELLPMLAKCQVSYESVVHMNGDGRAVRMSGRALEVLGGGESLNLLRGDIERVLFQRLDEQIEVRFNSSVTEVENVAGGVRLRLSDGSVERADLLIGADGVGSTVRQVVFGPVERFRYDLNYLVAVFDLDRVPAEVPPRTSISLNADGRQAAVANLDAGRGISLFVCKSADPVTGLRAGARATLSSAFGDLGWIVPDLIRQVPGDSALYFDSVSQVRMDSWSQDRVVLLGDAAWCVSLFAGAGASLAIGGADLLASILEREVNVDDALRLWEAGLRPQVLTRQTARRNIHTLLGLLADLHGEIELFEVDL